MNQSSQPSTVSDVKKTQADYVNNSNPPQFRNETIYGSTQGPNAEQRRIGWFKDTQKNKPQSNSIAAACLIFTSAGMSLALSIGFGPYPYGSHIQICWFIAAIIGACISAVLAHHISYRVFVIVASGLVIVNGGLYIAASEGTISVVLARYCDGIGFGLTLIPTILAASEQSVKRFRGMVLSLEQIGLASGSLWMTVYFTYGRFVSKVHGTAAVVFGLIALVFAFFLTIESPIFLLRKGNQIEAVNVLCRLQKPKTITDETYALLHESKALLEEDATRGISINISNSWIPMAKMILFRCFVSMSFSYPLTMVLLHSISVDSVTSGFVNSFFICIYVLMRLIGAIISEFLLDTVGRRKPSSVALLANGAIIIAIACMDKNIDSRIVTYLLLIYQLISGIMVPASTCYLGEAFSVSVKPYFILVAIVAENILQIITCCAISVFSDTAFCYALGSLQTVYGILFFFTMPETKQTSLREALKMFQSIYIVRDRTGPS